MHRGAHERGGAGGKGMLSEADPMCFCLCGECGGKGGLLYRRGGVETGPPGHRRNCAAGGFPLAPGTVVRDIPALRAKIPR